MPLHLTSLDPQNRFSIRCETLVVNLHGAAVRAPALAPLAAPVRIETADHRSTTGWITDFETLGQNPKQWLLGIALSEPGNFWGVPNPPPDWVRTAPQLAPPSPQDPERKFGIWPGAYGPEGAGKVTVMSKPQAGEADSQSLRPASDEPEAVYSRVRGDLEQRIAEQWRRLRSEVEPQILAANRAWQQKIDEALTAWRDERAALEGNLRELQEEIRKKIDSPMQQPPQDKKAEAVALATKLQQHLTATLPAAVKQLQQDLLAEVEHRERALSRTIVNQIEELRASQSDVRKLMGNLAGELSSQSERGLAALRVQVQQMTEQHAAELTARLQEQYAGAEAALHTAGRNLADSARQQLEADVRHQQRELAVSHLSLHEQMEALNLREQRLEARLSEILQTREYVESISREIPGMIEKRTCEALEAVLQKMSGPVQEQFTKQCQSELAVLQEQARKTAGLQQKISESEQQFQDFLAERRKEADDLLRRQATELSASLQGRLEEHFQGGQKRFDEAQSSALRQLEMLQESACQVTSHFNAELQKQADSVVTETVAKVEQRLQAVREGVYRARQDAAHAEQESATLRQQAEDARASLSQEVKKFEALMHDSLLQAAAEIKGRIHQALEMAEEPLDRRSRDLQSQIAAAAQQMTEELQKQFAEARDRLQKDAAGSQAQARQVFQENLAQVMESFRHDSENLARRSIERWQAAVNATLAEVPKLLGEKFSADFTGG